MQTNDTTNGKPLDDGDIEILRQYEGLKKVMEQRGLSSGYQPQTHPAISMPQAKEQNVQVVESDRTVKLEEKAYPSFKTLSVETVPPNSEMLGLVAQLVAVGNKKGYLDANNPQGQMNISLMAGDPEVREILDRIIIRSMTAGSYINFLVSQLEAINSFSTR